MKSDIFVEFSNTLTQKQSGSSSVLGNLFTIQSSDLFAVVYKSSKIILGFYSKKYSVYSFGHFSAHHDDHDDDDLSMRAMTITKRGRASMEIESRSQVLIL